MKVCLSVSLSDVHLRLVGRCNWLAGCVSCATVCVCMRERRTLSLFGSHESVRFPIVHFNDSLFIRPAFEWSFFILHSISIAGHHRSTHQAGCTMGNRTDCSCAISHHLSCVVLVVFAIRLPAPNTGPVDEVKAVSQQQQQPPHERRRETRGGGGGGGGGLSLVGWLACMGRQKSIWPPGKTPCLVAALTWLPVLTVHLSPARRL